MASRETAEKWLAELTHIPTAPGVEHRVVEWVRTWVARRSDLKLTVDSGGNVLITQKGRKNRPLVVAVAHMDHPAFVVTSVGTEGVRFEFRGGVDAPYFKEARVDIQHPDGVRGLRVVAYDPKSGTGTLSPGRGRVEVGDIGMWRFPRGKTQQGMFRAPACDDLAGAAASLAALDRVRGRTELRHFAVLLTRAEEVGFIGALHAARNQTVPDDSRILSIETSRELPIAPIGAGPIIRTGDRATVFDRELTNRITAVARASGLKHQRKLMDAGGCEATAFGGYGYQASGLCVPLRNWHNRGNLAEVEAGGGPAIAMLEEISLDDFHGLVDLIVLAVSAADIETPLRGLLDQAYESGSHVLG